MANFGALPINAGVAKNKFVHLEPALEPFLERSNASNIWYFVF